LSIEGFHGRTHRYRSGTRHPGSATPAEADAQKRPDLLELLHVASGQDVADEQDRDARFQGILSRADVRDQAAEQRDRAAEERFPHPGDRQGWLDRDWAGRDRDAAAIDRADLLALLGEPTGDENEPTD
jgi:hypothetical protein